MADKKISALTAATLPLAGTEVLPIVQSGTTKKVAVDDLTAGKSVVANTFSAATGSPALSISNQATGAARIQGTNTGGTFYFGLDSSGGGLFSAYSPTLYYTGNYPIVMGNNGTLQFSIQTNGDVKANVGNLVVGTAGKGINFIANTPAAGMTSQLLNWYEEGTFTPTYTSTGTPPTVTYSHQYGKYTRIGRQVFFTVEIGTNSATAGTGLLAVGGLPFTAVNDRFTGTFSVGYADNFTTAAPSGGYVFAAETMARLTYETSATSKAEMLTTFLTNGSGQNYLVISGSYIV